MMTLGLQCLKQAAGENGACGRTARSDAEVVNKNANDAVTTLLLNLVERIVLVLPVRYRHVGSPFVQVCNGLNT